MYSSIGGLEISGEVGSLIGGGKGPENIDAKGITEGLTAPVVSTIFVVI